MIYKSALVLVLITIFSIEGSLDNDSAIKGTELVFAFMVHRHGDRTPVNATMFLLAPKDYSKVQSLIEPWGYGQLTDVGLRTGHKIGHFIRRRYNDLISHLYNRSEMYIRSTDSTRTKMTVLTAMTAVYPPTGYSWSDEVNWVPVPYTTVPDKYDFNLAILNCPTLMTFFHGAMRAPSLRMGPYADLAKNVSEIIGVNMSKMPIALSTVYDLYVSLDSLGYPLPDEVRDILPELEKAADVGCDITMGDESYLPLQAGPLLNEFFTHADKIISGAHTQKVRVYSAHDVNVYSFKAISRAVPRQGVPKYGSLFALELRRVMATGEYVVQPVYLSDPKVGTENYLQIEGCGDTLCNYETFRSLTASDVRTEDDWRVECGFTHDMDVDSSYID